MIRKLPFMLIALCFLLSCGGDDPLDTKPEDDIKPEQPEKPSEPDDPEDPENPEKPETQTKRIKTMTVFSQDGYFVESNLSYDEKNRISQIKSHIAANRTHDVITNLSYQDDLILMETKYNGVTGKQELVLNEQGLVDTYTWEEYSDSRSRSFEYEDGYLVKQSYDGDYYVYRYMNGNLFSYSYMFYENYGGGGAYYEDVSHITYTENENKLGISPMLLTEDYRTLGIPLSLEGLEDFYLYNGFFCFYGGLFGKPSKNLKKNATEGGESISFEYKFDKDGYPIEITSKYFDDGEYIPDDEESFTVNIEYWED